MNTPASHAVVDVTPNDKQQVVVHTTPVIHEQSTKLIAAIAEAASNPKVDVVKMKELMAMRKEVMDEQRQIAFDAAFAAMQSELPEIEERGDISGESKRTGTKISQKYATFEDILSKVRPILAKYGFGLRFNIQDEQQFIRVTAILSHADGHRESTSKLLPKDTSGSKNAVQAEGSSVSYGKRYTMNAILNIATRGQDDDGRAAAPAPQEAFITPEQRDILNRTLEGPGEYVGQFCKENGLNNLGEIEAGSFDVALAKAKRLMANRKA